MTTTQTRLTRRSSRRGETVTLTETTTGRTWTGTLDSWGSQNVGVRLDEETKRRNGTDWKVKTFWTGAVTVTR